MGTHTAAGGDELTSKLQTHCRYRHLGPASSLTGCVGGSGGTGGGPQTPRGTPGEGAGMKDALLLRAQGGPAEMLRAPREVHRTPKL